jgi:hypothetical protein
VPVRFTDDFTDGLAAGWQAKNAMSGKYATDATGLTLTGLVGGDALMLPLPEESLVVGDYVVEVEFTTTGVTFIGPVLVDDSGWGINASAWTSPGAPLIGRCSNFIYNDAYTYAGSGVYKFLRLEKAGANYRLGFSADGTTWNYTSNIVRGVTGWTPTHFGIAHQADSSLRTATIKSITVSDSGPATPDPLPPVPTTMEILSIPGIRGFWSADTIGAADGAGLTEWNDLVSGAQMTPSAGGSPIHEATAGRDGGPAVKFGTTPGYFKLPNGFTSGWTAGEMFMVKRVTTTGNHTTHGIDTTDDEYYPASGTIYDPFGTTSRKSFGQIKPIINWRCYDSLSASGKWQAWTDGLSHYGPVGNTVSFPGGVSNIGANSYPSTADFTYISAVLLFDRELTQTERDTVTRYLMAEPSGGVPVLTDPPTAIVGITVLTDASTAEVAWPMRYGETSWDVRIDGGAPITVTEPTHTFTGLTNDTDYVIEVRATNSIGTGPYGAVEAHTQTRYLYDLVSRPDSAVSPGTPDYGGPYTVRSGTAGVQTTRLYAVANETVVTFPAAADVLFEVTLEADPGDFSLLLRYKDLSNYWMFHLTNSAASIYRRKAGSFYQMAYAGYRPPIGATLQVLALGDDLFWGWDDKWYLSVKDEYPDALATDAGLRFANTSARVDVLSAIASSAVLLTGAVTDEQFAAATQEAALLYKGRDTKTLDIGGIA